VEIGEGAAGAQRPSILRRVVLWMVSVIGALALAFAALIGNFLLLGWESGQDHEYRVSQLLADAQPVSGWVDPASDDDLADVPFNELQVVATHNSYVLQPTWLQTVVIGLVEPSDAVTLQYGHAPLWDQLEAGIRSFELDLRWNGDKYILNHVPLVANRANATDFELALREIVLWSESHPGHLPISIMLELKSDYMFLDPTLRPFDADALSVLDTTLDGMVGDALFTPDDLRGSADSLRTAVADTGWPTVDQLSGSMMFFFSNDEAIREAYLDGHANLEGRSVFTSSLTGADDAVFAVRDDPADVEITAEREAGLIVRTRADADLATSVTERERALASGAQVVSTDFPPSEPQAETGYVVQFRGGFLARHFE
jgi:hypothetical protein